MSHEMTAPPEMLMKRERTPVRDIVLRTLPAHGHLPNEGEMLALQTVTVTTALRKKAKNTDC